MHNIKDPLLPLLKTQECARLLPFPGDPTTELISLFMFSKMEKVFNGSSFESQGFSPSFSHRVQVSFIRLKETGTNTVVCHRDFFLQEIKPYQKQGGWWTSEDLLDRSFQNDLSHQ